MPKFHVIRRHPTSTQARGGTSPIEIDMAALLNVIGSWARACGQWAAMMRWSECLFVLLSTCAVAGTFAQVPTYAVPEAPVEERIDSLIASMTLDEKIQALGSDPSVPRLGLRLSGHIEGLHGVALGGPGGWGRIRNPDGTVRDEPVPTTQFPQAVGLGETWDVDVLRKVAEIEGQEARYAFHSAKYKRGGLVVRAPNADLA